MFKRVFWLSTGVAVGASGAFWAKRKVEQTVERYLPEQVAERVGTSARDLSRTVKAAAHEGREAMRATEAELRARVEARTFTGGPSRATPGSATSSAGAGSARPPARHGARRASRTPDPTTTPSSPRRRARR